MSSGAHNNKHTIIIPSCTPRLSYSNPPLLFTTGATRPRRATASTQRRGPAQRS